jgi:hypothetical protein
LDEAKKELIKRIEKISKELEHSYVGLAFLDWALRISREYRPEELDFQKKVEEISNELKSMAGSIGHFN